MEYISQFDTQSEPSAAAWLEEAIDEGRDERKWKKLGLGQCQQINEKHKQDTQASSGLIKWRFVSLIRIIIAGQTNAETGEKKSAATWQFAHCSGRRRQLAGGRWLMMCWGDKNTKWAGWAMKCFHNLVPWRAVLKYFPNDK